MVEVHISSEIHGQDFITLYWVLYSMHVRNIMQCRTGCQFIRITLGSFSCSPHDIVGYMAAVILILKLILKKTWNLEHK